SSPTRDPPVLPPSLHDALPIFQALRRLEGACQGRHTQLLRHGGADGLRRLDVGERRERLGHGGRGRKALLRRFGQGLFEKAIERDRKSTRLNSSHLGISYAVFC